MDRVVIFILAAALLYLVIAKPKPQESFENTTLPVPRDVIALIISAVQAKEPGWVPVDTVYVNQVMTDQGAGLFNSRFFFYDTNRYLGTQIDVQASVEGDKASIISMTPATSIETQNTLFPYTAPKYQDYSDISDSVNRALNDYLAMGARGDVRAPAQF
jgi:hypothetical protein